MGRSHFLSGLVTAGAVMMPIPAPLPVKLACTALGGISAILPDIDHPSSTITKYFPIITYPLSKFSRWLSKTVYHVTKSRKDVQNAAATHRWLTHTFAASLVYGALVAWALSFHPYWPCFGLAAMVGWSTHVGGDMLTFGGCPYLWPIPIEGKRWRAIRSPIPFKTDGFSERMIVYPMLAVLSVAVIAGEVLETFWQ